MDARTTFAAGALGLAAGVGTLSAAEPAARLRLAAEPPVARGLAPEATPPRPDGWMTTPTGPAVRPLSPDGPPTPKPASTGTPPAAKPSLLASTWDEMKQALAGKPSAPPAPKPTATVPPAPPAVPTQSPGVYAGPPAYRWYGYGTVSPAPASAGPAPRGSANWLTQTGATPGAFPATAGSQTPEPIDLLPPAAPVGNYPPQLPAFRSESAFPDYPPLPPGAVLVGEGPPILVTNPAAPPAFTAPYPAPPAPPPATPTPPAARKSVPANTVSMPPEPPPGGLVYPPPTPVGVPVSAAPAPAALPALAWQTSGAAEAVAFTQSRPAATPPARNPDADPSGSPDIVPVTLPVPPLQYPDVNAPAPKAEWVPVGRGQAAAPKPTIRQATAAAADGLATVTDATFTAPNKLVVKFTAATEGDARAAAAAIAKLPQLKPVAVEFVATVGGR